MESLMAMGSFISTIKTIWRERLLMVDVKVMADLSKKMEAIMKETSGIMWQMDMGFSLAKRDSNIKDSGKITCLMALGKQSIQMELDMWDNSSTTNAKGKEHCMLLGICIEEILEREKSMDHSGLRPRTEIYMMENGKITKNMEWEFMNGQMEALTRGNTMMIRDTVMAK